MAALIPKASITRWLGRSTPAYVSYPAAAAAGSLLAVCSCTIVPLFAGIYRKGAGIGPAMTFLFFAPAGNIMALAYTGSILGPEFAVARVVFCLMFGIGIGILMALVFWRDDASHDAQTDTLFAAQASIAPAAWGPAVAGGPADCWHAEAVAIDHHRGHLHFAPVLGSPMAGDPVRLGAL
ncbi:putative permease [Hydrogenophaga sp. T4]|nr:putative permease [Hydrogenophaga sp. T4]